MSFFSNHFKRRRQGEEVELQRASPIPPSTPPSGASAADLRRLAAAAAAAPPERTQDAGGEAAQAPAEAGAKAPGDAQQQEEEERRARVRDRAAFFESLIKERSTRGSGPSPSSSMGRGSDSDSDGEAAGMWHPPPPAGSPGGNRQAAAAAAAAAEAAATIESLRLELARVDLERCAAVNALNRKSHEVANLLGVVKELSQSRAAALSARLTLAERYNDLQREYARIVRVADLSREVSRENLGLTSAAREAACAAERRAAVAARDAEVLGDAERRAAAENAALREKVSLLERLGPWEEAAASACMREFRARVWETY